MWALVLAKDDAVESLKALVGPTSLEAKHSAPKSIRAEFGTDLRMQAVMCAESDSQAREWQSVLFAMKEQQLSRHVEEIERSLVLISPHLVDNEHSAAIIDRIVCRGWQISKREEVNISPEIFLALYPAFENNSGYADAVKVFTNGAAMALVIQGQNTIAELTEMLNGDFGINATFGAESQIAAFASETIDQALEQIGILFPIILNAGDSLSRPVSAMHLAPEEQTLALIKPDAYGAGKKSEILAMITADGFKIVKEKEVQLSYAQACAFYKEHDGKPFYQDLTVWMSRYPFS